MKKDFTTYIQKQIQICSNNELGYCAHGMPGVAK